MRMTWFRIVSTIGVVMLSACGASDPADDVLFVQTSRGLALVRPQADSVAVRLSDAVPSIDWSAVVRATPVGRETKVVALNASSGSRLWAQDVSGDLQVKVASPGAGLVALGKPRDGDAYEAGRSSTTFVLTGPREQEPRRITLPGNFEPEAFSTDRGSLFVIQYLPAKAPSRYRVRRLDLRTEQVTGVYTVDAELQQSMQGTARVQAAGPDGRRLYTLYSHQGADGRLRAFIHVLSLDELWAHCIDLPSAFGSSAEQPIALSVAADGRRLYVANASTDTVAEVDTEALRVARTTHVAFGSRGDAAHAEGGSDGMLYLGSGTGLVSVDSGSLKMRRSWEMPSTITGIQLGPDGARLYVGMKDQIAVLDSETGATLPPLRLPPNGAIDQLGRSTQRLDDGRFGIKCAC
jgi:outer membrane protein assembly factor BamB